MTYHLGPIDPSRRPELFADPRDEEAEEPDDLRREILRRDFLEGLAHRALLIRLLRRRSQRKGASARSSSVWRRAISRRSRLVVRGLRTQ